MLCDAGGAGSDLLAGGAGDDALLGDNDAMSMDHNLNSWRFDATDHTVIFSTDLMAFNDPPVPETSGNDVMYAGAGNDYAVGGYGNDVIFCRDMVLKVFVPVKSINEEIYRSVV